jgi:hypothetical protein
MSAPTVGQSAGGGTAKTSARTPHQKCWPQPAQGAQAMTGDHSSRRASVTDHFAVPDSPLRDRSGGPYSAVTAVAQHAMQWKNAGQQQ